MNTVFRLTALAVIVGTATGCSRHDVNTFERYCETLRGVDLQKKYEPIWSGAFSVSFEGNAIRDDYTNLLDKEYMQTVVGRAPRMVWREGNSLHLTNPSSYFHADPASFIQTWQSGLALAKASQHTNPADTCRFGAAATLFDDVIIHTLRSTVGLKLDTDDVTRIPTDRRKHFQWVPD